MTVENLAANGSVPVQPIAIVKQTASGTKGKKLKTKARSTGTPMTRAAKIIKRLAQLPTT